MLKAQCGVRGKQRSPNLEHGFNQGAVINGTIGGRVKWLDTLHRMADGSGGDGTGEEKPGGGGEG